MEESFTINRANLSQQIADQLEEWILSSPRGKVDTKLPSEQRLATRYGVSRPVIREALKMLQERGLLTLRNGLGAFVTRPQAGTVEAAINRFSQMHDITDQDLTQMRGIIEMNAARLAAEHATDEDLAALRENLEQFRNKTLGLKERVQLDSQFHLLIAHASGNPLVEMFNLVLVSLLADYMGKGVLIPGGIDDAIARHQKVYDAIAAHDEGATMEAMSEHLRVSEQNVAQFNEKSKKRTR